MHAKRGEIATILTVTSLVVMAVGLYFGSTRKPDLSRSKAAEDCLYNATAVVVKGTEDGPLLTLEENKNIPLKVVNNHGQEGNFINSPTGYYYNFTQNPFKFGPYRRPIEGVPDKAWVELKGLYEGLPDEEPPTGWYIKKTFCSPINGGLGCGTVEDPVQLPPDLRISNFHVSCGVHMKYGWVVERISSAKTTPTATIAPTAKIPTATNTSTPKATNTPTPTATPRPTTIPTNTPTSTPTNTPTPIPTRQQAVCNTAITAGRYSPDPNIKFWEMGNTAGTVYLSYGMYGIPDELKISHDDETVFETNGVTAGTRSNIPIQYIPKTTTKFNATLTSSRDKQNTIWWYALSCPRDPIPTTSLCIAAHPIKSISGTIKFDSQISEACRDNNCKVRVLLEQQNTGILVREVTGPDYRYSFGAVKIDPGTHILVDRVEIPNRSSELNETAIPSNCFGSRKIREHDTACGIDMSKEFDCQATNVDFIVTNFGRPTSESQNPLRIVDINKDRRVNIVDLGLVLKAFGSKVKGNTADINKDGVVNTLDVARVIGNLSKSVSLE